MAPSPRALFEAHTQMVDWALWSLCRGLPAHCDRDAYRQAGLLALWQAAGRYDPSRGVKFGTYARLRVRGAMVDEMRAQMHGSRGNPQPQPRSLDEIVLLDDSDVRRQPADPRDGYAEAEAALTVGSLLGTLGARARYAVEQTYLLGRPLSDVAQDLHCTESRVSQIRAQALRRMAAHA